MATKTSGQIEREFIENLKTQSGKDLGVWITEIDSFGAEKRGDVIEQLKNRHGFGHMHASLLADIYFNGGKPVYADTGQLLDNQFAKASEEMRPLFEKLMAFILQEFPGATVLPKKTYVSILEKREFAAINIRAKEIRIGFDLGDRPFDNRVGKAKLTGPMPRISHMIVVSGGEPELKRGELTDLLRGSYARTHS